jgi:hypothetical protein
MADFERLTELDICPKCANGQVYYEKLDENEILFCSCPDCSGRVLECETCGFRGIYK